MDRRVVAVRVRGRRGVGSVVMLLSEKQAQEKWCPMVRRPDSQTAQNVFGDTNCIAAGCMMWRWEDAAFPELGKLGYCGLAGHWSAAR